MLASAGLLFCCSYLFLIESTSAKFNWNFGRKLFLNGIFECPEEKSYTSDDDVDQDAQLDTIGLLVKYGYPAENHYVTTEDGYILGVHRIARPGATPVFLMHGLLDSSATWVIMGPHKGFAYMLYNLGYDVWMGNARGNTYSKNHKTLNPKKSAFWDFSLHEIGTRDLPAMIDYVIEETKFDRIQYVGHSQGTTTFWIMCSELPDYNKKIISMQALAPVAYLNYAKSPPVKYLSRIAPAFATISHLIGEDEFLPSNKFFKLFALAVCDDSSIVQDICSNALFVIAGFDKSQLNMTMLPVILGHTPAGASNKQVEHYAQIKNSNKFRQFDYGFIKNKFKYGQFSPPKYNLGNVRTKVALYYSGNDWFAAIKDVDRLFGELPNTIGKYLVPDLDFNHLDFIWAIEGREMLYDKVVATMRGVE